MRSVFGEGFVSGDYIFGQATFVLVTGAAYCIDAVYTLVYGLTGLGMCCIDVVGSN